MNKDISFKVESRRNVVDDVNNAQPFLMLPSNEAPVKTSRAPTLTASGNDADHHCKQSGTAC